MRTKTIALAGACAWVLAWALSGSAGTGTPADIDYALRLSSAVYGAPLGEMRAISRCESVGYTDFYNGPGTAPPRHPSRTQRARATGLFQFLYSTWTRTPYGRAGYDRMNHLANALAAGWLWKHDGGSWREWECRP